MQIQKVKWLAVRIYIVTASTSQRTSGCGICWILTACFSEDQEGFFSCFAILASGALQILEIRALKNVQHAIIMRLNICRFHKESTLDLITTKSAECPLSLDAHES